MIRPISGERDARIDSDTLTSNCIILGHDLMIDFYFYWPNTLAKHNIILRERLSNDSQTIMMSKSKTFRFSWGRLVYPAYAVPSENI